MNKVFFDYDYDKNRGVIFSDDFILSYRNKVSVKHNKYKDRLVLTVALPRSSASTAREKNA